MTLLYSSLQEVLVMKQIMRLFYAIKSFVTIVRDPNQLEMVFALREQIADENVLKAIRAHLAQDPDGAKALQDRPVVGKLDLRALESLPQGTLGRTFVEFLRKNKLDPNAIPRLPANNELEFMEMHFYETHDLWHVVTNFETDVAGELGLQAFYLAQFPASLAAAILSAGLLNTMLYRMDERELRMDEIVRGYQMGRAAKPLFGARWNDLWALPLHEVRARFNLTPHPGRAASTSRPLSGHTVDVASAV